MSKLLNKFSLSAPFLILPGLFVATVNITMADVVRDPMQPPAFALEKFRLAKLKKSSLHQASPSTTRKPVKKSLKLSSILIGKKRSVAIIDDQMLVVGDKIGGAKLLRIFKDRVQLSRSGRKIELKLDNEISAIRKQAVESKL